MVWVWRVFVGGVVCYKFVVSVLGLGCFDVWCCGAVLGGACRFDVC